MTFFLNAHLCCSAAVLIIIISVKRALFSSIVFHIISCKFGGSSKIQKEVIYSPLPKNNYLWWFFEEASLIKIQTPWSCAMFDLSKTHEKLLGAISLPMHLLQKKPLLFISSLCYSLSTWEKTQLILFWLIGPFEPFDSGGLTLDKYYLPLD